MERRIARIVFLFFLLLISNAVFSQQREYIVGRLLDAKTQEPIAFASIRIKDRALGIISNTDGSFKIPVRYKEYGDIIEISSMGYQSKEFLIHDFSIYEINNVRLQPAFLELQEAVVSAQRRRKKNFSAKNIVRKAVKAIPDNYSSIPFSTIGYYRDYQLKDSAYLNLNEAILEVFDPGFTQLDEPDTKVGIYDYKRNMDFGRDSLSANSYDYKNYRKVVRNAYLPNYGGNEFTILRVHDAIRNYKIDSYSFVNKIEIDLFNNHNFYKEEDTYTEEEVLYTIKIMKMIPGYSLHGKFYISKKDFAIHKMEYAIYNSSNTDNSKVQNKHGNTNQLLFEVTTEYVRKYSKMYLNYISFHNSFQLSRPPEFIVNEIIADRQNRCFEVRFNKDIDPTSAGRKKNYKFKFKGRRIRFRKMVVFDNAVRLYPDLSTVEIGKMLDDLASASRRKVELKELLETEISSVRTPGITESHVLNERKLADYQQFREFFVQRVKPYAIAPLDSLLMDKRRPIFKDQRITMPANFGDYWMNTPLKKSQ